MVRIEPREADFKAYQSHRGLMPSVTTILKVFERPYYQRWRQRVGDREADRIAGEAKVFGTKMHAAAELVARNFALGLSPALSEAAVEPELRPYAAAVRSWFDGFVLDVLGTEMSLVSPERGYGGTLDLYCQLKDGSYAVVDFKTTSSLTREHGLQTCAYAVLLRDAGHTVNRRIVVRIKKEKPGAYHARVYKDGAEDYEAWRACVVLWWWKHKRRMDKLKAA